MSIWNKEYQENLKGLPKDAWVPWIKGRIGEKSVEISCVHTSEPHGLISWGWDGNKKIILLRDGSQENYPKKEFRIRIHTAMLNVAKEMCASLNKEFPKGIK